MVEDIIFILGKGGLVLIPIFLVAQIGWYFVVERLFHLKKMDFSQKKFWGKAPMDPEKLRNYISGPNSHPGILNQIISKLSKKWENGEKAMQQGIREVLNENVPGFKAHFSTIAVMAGSAPLLGLLGTVTGMVTTFKIITQYGVGNPSMMAEGISEALLTTQAGLIVGFPLVLMHNYLLNKADEIENECITVATKLINMLR